MTIDEHIASLLYRYDCVIIPGFGGFVINPRSATIGAGNDKFNPPSREITFNQNLVRNDGLLADVIAANEEVSFDEAIRKIDAFNTKNQEDLSAGLTVLIKDVGGFTKDSLGVLSFEPDSEANFLRTSFGLGSFHSPAIKRDSIERKIEETILKVIPKEVPAASAPILATTSPKAKKELKILKYWPAAAVILLLIISSTVLVQTNVLDKISINYSDLNPFNDSVESVYDERESEIKSENEAENKDEVEVWLESIPETPLVKEAAKSKVKKRFHVIGGCFKFKANAKKMMRRLKKRGFEPTMVGKNGIGLQRVAFGSYETRAEARDVLKYVKSTQMDGAWLYVSKR